MVKYLFPKNFHIIFLFKIIYLQYLKNKFFTFSIKKDDDFKEIRILNFISILKTYDIKNNYDCLIILGDRNNELFSHIIDNKKLFYFKNISFIDIF